MNLNCFYECELVSDWYVTFLNIRHASLYENMKTNILHCAVFKYSLCVTILKFPDAYTALLGILIPHMRHYAEISNFFHSVIQCYLYVTMLKIAGAHASTCGFPYFSFYGALPLLQSKYASICGKIKAHIRYCAAFQGFFCSCRILVSTCHVM